MDCLQSFSIICIICFPAVTAYVTVACLKLSSFAYIWYYKNKNWLQFLFFVKADALKQQVSKFYTHILSTEASHHIYFSQRPVIHVNKLASVLRICESGCEGQ